MNSDVLGERMFINLKIITRRLWCYIKHVYMFGLLFKLVKWLFLIGVENINYSMDI